NQHLHYEKKLEQVRSQQELLQEARIASTHAAQAVSSLASVQQVASNPEKVLASLVDCLFAPRERLYMHYEEGYPLHMGNDKENNLLPMMITYDRRHWLVCIVGFPIAMAQEALEKEAHNHRFILI
ncbi:MAG: hypothetical protein LBB51_05090, partial [Zoogloeaceae bacterium]|nr:hypothetical protein [Zoogloeaceae bacterium]